MLPALESEDNLRLFSRTLSACQLLLFTPQAQAAHTQSGGGGVPIIHVCREPATGTWMANRDHSCNEHYAIPAD